MNDAEVLSELRRMTATPSIEAAWALLQEQMAAFGLDRILYATTRFRAGVGRIMETDVHDALILTNHARAYMDDFIGKGYYFQAPTVRWVAENTGAISWRHTARAYAEGTLSESERRVVAFNAEHGITAGYTLSFHEVSSRAAGGVGLSSSAMDQDAVDALWAKSGQAIEVMNAVAHLKFNDLPYEGHDRSLTSRQREVLEMVADGKTVQDIALLIERKAATVEKHLRLAREALEVETTAQAILKASMQNQFFLVGESGTHVT